MMDECYDDDDFHYKPKSCKTHNLKKSLNKINKKLFKQKNSRVIIYYKIKTLSSQFQPLHDKAQSSATVTVPFCNGK